MLERKEPERKPESTQQKSTEDTSELSRAQRWEQAARVGNKSFLIAAEPAVTYGIGKLAFFTARAVDATQYLAQEIRNQCCARPGKSSE